MKLSLNVSPNLLTMSRVKLHALPFLLLRIIPVKFLCHTRKNFTGRDNFFMRIPVKFLRVSKVYGGKIFTGRLSTEIYP